MSVSKSTVDILTVEILHLSVLSMASSSHIYNPVGHCTVDVHFNVQLLPDHTIVVMKDMIIDYISFLAINFFYYLTLILLRLFQQHYCYNVTGQSQESEGSCKPARIKEVHSKLHSFQASLCTLTATHLTLIYVCTYIRLSVPLGCLIKQAGINIHTILNMWETPGIEPVTSDLTSVYQISSSTN